MMSAAASKVPGGGPLLSDGLRRVIWPQPPGAPLQPQPQPLVLARRRPISAASAKGSQQPSTRRAC